MLRTLPSRNRRSDRSNSSRDACRETLPSIGATNLGGAQVPASSPRIRFAPRCESLARSPSQKVARHRPVPSHSPARAPSINIDSYCELLAPCLSACAAHSLGSGAAPIAKKASFIAAHIDSPPVVASAAHIDTPPSPRVDRLGGETWMNCRSERFHDLCDHSAEVFLNCITARAWRSGNRVSRTATVRQALIAANSPSTAPCNTGEW